MRALLAIGVPYADALTLPVPFALAMLKDGRPNNTRPTRQTSPDAPRMVATRRKAKD